MRASDYTVPKVSKWSYCLLHRGGCEELISGGRVGKDFWDKYEY